MRTASVIVPACFVLLASSAPSALAQNLSERIDHVMRTRAAAQANNSSGAAMLGALLYTDVTVRFDETTAREAINYLAKLLNISIVGRFSDDRTGNGIDPQTPITLNAENVAALTVLEQILDQCEDLEPTTWQLRDGFVEVGTKERLSVPAAREVRYYPIRDLLFEVPHFDNAPDFNINAAFSSGGGGSGGGGRGGGGGGSGGGGSGGGGSGGGGLFGDAEDVDRVPEEERAQQIIDIITQTIEPDMWETGGGDAASIRYYQGTLIIRAPDFIQRQIGGYPFAIRQSARVSPAAELRYVTFSGVTSNVQIVGTKVITATGAVGGGGTGGTSGAAPATPAPAQP